MSKSWPTKPLGELCNLINGRAFKPSDWGSAGRPIVRIQNLNDAKKPFNYFNGRVAPNHLIDTGEVLLSWSGTPGTSFGCFRWERGPGVLNQHIFKVIVDEAQIDSDFFIAAVNSRLEEMISKAHGGVGLRHITKSKLEAIYLPVPPLPEQRRIFARIKECMERVEEVGNLSNDSLAEADAVLPAMLNEAFTAASKKYRTATIGNLAIETRYGTSRKCDPKPKGIPILRIPNVMGGFVNFNNIKYCELDRSERMKVELTDGDLLFVRTNGSRDLVGRCAIYESNGGVSPHGFASYLIRVRLDTSRILPHFLAFFLNSTQGREALDERRRTSAGQFNINSENLRTICLPVPPVEKQQEMIQYLQSHQTAIEEVRGGMRASLDEKSHLRDAILRKAFAGEL